MNLLPAFTAAPATNQVYNVDCFTLFKAMPDNSVDLIFADPPYNLGYKYDGYYDQRADSEYMTWCKAWLSECARILKPTGTLFVLHIPRYAIEIAAYLNGLLNFQHWITWKAASRKSHKPLMPEHYALLYYTKSDLFTVNEIRAKHRRCRKCGELIADYGGKKHLIHPTGPQISDVWTDIGRAKHGQRGEHPCKLPDRLLERIIGLASDPGDLVLDPFIGVGTTAYVAQRMSRQYLGCDTSELYIRMAKQRLTQPLLLLESEAV